MRAGFARKSNMTKEDMDASQETRFRLVLNEHKEIKQASRLCSQMETRAAVLLKKKNLSQSFPL